MKRFVVVLAVLVSVAVPVVAGGKPDLVATGGISITAEELERTVGNRLMRVRTDEYNIRRAALEELIAERLVAAEAKRRGVTSEELLRAEVDAKVTMPSAQDVEPFYEGTKERYGNATKEEAIAQIIEGMGRQKRGARLAEFHKQLRDAAQLRITLEPPRIDVAVEGPARGNPDAPVTIVEYSDFECPYCARAATTIRKVESEYAGKVRIVFRDFPLASHRGAPRAAEAAHCAGDQGKYWEMHDRLFSKGGAIAETDIRRYSGELQLDPVKFGECLQAATHTPTWKAAQAEGIANGVQSTPTFFINGRMIAGAAPYESFREVIEEELAERRTPTK